MHGRPREYKNKLRDPKAQESYKKKVDAIRNGTALVLQCRKLKRYDDTVMVASANLLKVVPEIYTLWNFRREALTPVFEAGGAAAQQASDQELALTFACLSENPKSYSTWHHRKWTVLKGLCSLPAELKLISKALEEDQRNFHAWNYRQFIVKLMGRSPAEELEYTEEKVAENFSNYSAWHYRTILLHKMHCSAEEPTKGVAETGSSGAGSPPAPSTSGGFVGSASQVAPIPPEVLDQEYDMVHQAFATDSQDQAPWMYYRWLVGNSLAHLEAARGTPRGEEVGALLSNVLAREVERLEQDHLAAVPDAKWPLLTVARLKEAQARLKLAADPEAQLQEVRHIYERLMVLDPLRRGYYQDALDGKAFVVVQALGSV
mmetsp:Transcript_37806/g.84312  ORF Transcript_37806/g.84312 Transcript_37806/m.84312 type:complete len:375 (+) Transcript_37806:69-1193(+)|eukprot:CAMPEP_0202902806 /NCGR_PEP_ID=MMETSP1392-20130828/17060_1 /ASSEMBLY_ACC=CAM_ASM_000868 /TAXON_ID=225041 /ORGANISM="Chlamydomonas chlamydogama, Strain SAG 11-48b" /LENGTH=374 /DNA_ID=CAMNT_0049589613 /DNA_START=69 /DNA_END=1193 /DNA_ORIENTATION=-